MNKGWRFEPTRHSLAAKGIRTKGLGSLKGKISAFATIDYHGNLYERVPVDDPKILMFGTPEYKTMVHDRIVKYNDTIDKYGEEKGMLVFPTEEQAQLWMDEYTGQISDGKYENSRVNFERYSDLKVYIDPNADYTKLYVDDPSKYKKKLVFTDLLWLFSKDSTLGENPKDVRAIFSKAPTAGLIAYTLDIERALVDPIKIEK